MKKIILILLFLIVSCGCFADTNTYILGSGVESGGACATESSVYLCSASGSNYSLSSSAAGSIFTVDRAAAVASVDVAISFASDGSEIEVRWGVSRDLTTVYNASETFIVGSSDNGTVVNVPFTTKVEAATSTNYYVGYVLNSGGVSIGGGSTNPCGGDRIYSQGTWNMLQSAATDLSLEVNSCD